MKTEETDLRDFRRSLLEVSWRGFRFRGPLPRGAESRHGWQRPRNLQFHQLWRSARARRIPGPIPQVAAHGCLHRASGGVAAGARAGSSADRLSRPPNRPPRPSAPQAMRSQVEERGESAQITIPGPGFRLSMLLGLVDPHRHPGLRDFRAAARSSGAPTRRNRCSMYSLASCCSSLACCRCSASRTQVLTALRSHTRIIISREGLTIENRGALFTRRTRIPAADILGVDYSTSGGLLAAARSEAERRLQQGSAPAVASGRPPGLIARMGRETGPARQVQGHHRQIQGRAPQLRRRLAGRRGWLLVHHRKAGTAPRVIKDRSPDLHKGSLQALHEPRRRWSLEARCCPLVAAALGQAAPR